MFTSFFALIFIFAVNHTLIPVNMKPEPIIYQGTSRPAVIPNFVIKGPAVVTDTVVVSPDSTVIITIEPSRADSLEAGTVDSQSFTPDEFEEQKERAIDLWNRRREFLKQLNGKTDEPWNWT